MLSHQKLHTEDDIRVNTTLIIDGQAHLKSIGNPSKELETFCIFADNFVKSVLMMGEKYEVMNVSTYVNVKMTFVLIIMMKLMTLMMMIFHRFYVYQVYVYVIFSYDVYDSYSLL